LNITRERWEERAATVRESFSELLSIFDVQAAAGTAPHIQAPGPSASPNKSQITDHQTSVLRARPRFT
jgi:hypothetical protein